jgi:protein-S-isoprenylcysteine O-methyltransferase Ste14
MTQKKAKIALAISGVAFGISLFLCLLTWAAGRFAISAISPLFPKMPPWLIPFIGWMHLLVFLPIFLAGIYYLKPRGAIGQSPGLIQEGIYQYLRNPFYAGVSFTLTGLGLVLDHTGTFLTGLLWLLICFFQCRREEKELAEKFGRKYLSYKKNTPRFIPDFQRMIWDFFHHYGKIKCSKTK